MYGSLTLLPGQTHRLRPLFLWWDPNDVTYCRILPTDKTTWWLRRWCRCLVGQLWLLNAYATTTLPQQWTVEGSVFGAISLSCFCLCTKYHRNCWTDLRQIHTEDMFGPSLSRVWGSEINVTRDKNGIFRPFWQPPCGYVLRRLCCMQWTAEGFVSGAISPWFFVYVWNISGTA